MISQKGLFQLLICNRGFNRILTSSSVSASISSIIPAFIISLDRLRMVAATSGTCATPRVVSCRQVARLKESRSHGETASSKGRTLVMLEWPSG
jgi:hypothetical protein